MTKYKTYCENQMQLDEAKLKKSEEICSYWEEIIRNLNQMIQNDLEKFPNVYLKPVFESNTLIEIEVYERFEDKIGKFSIGSITRIDNLASLLRSFKKRELNLNDD